MLKTEAVGTWQTLMHWKIMFECCYCINSTKYLLKFGKNMTLYFVAVWQSTSDCTFVFKYPSSWSDSIKRFKMAIIIRFDHGVPEMTSWLLYNCSRGVQNEIKNHQKKIVKSPGTESLPSIIAPPPDISLLELLQRY